MVETLVNIDVPVTVVSFLVWILTYARLRRIGSTVTAKHRRLTAGLLVVGLLLATVRLALTAALLEAGWGFASDRVIIFAPLFIVGMAMVLRWTVPAVITRTNVEGVGNKPTGDVAAASLSRRLRGPGACVMASLLAAVGTMIVVPVPPLAPELLAYWACFSVGTLILTPRRRERSSGVRGRWRSAALVAAVLAVALVTAGGWSSSFLPATYDMTAHGENSHPPGEHQGAPAQKPVSVDTLTGDHDRTPDRSIRLEAQKTQLTLPGGTTIDALTFNGTLPGPTITAKKGELLEIILTNRDVDQGVSVHSHGYDVPNAEDGVPGMTQDAVEPGGRHVYRFRLDHAGTFWYHSHQVSSEQVKRGLFGSLVITDPAAPAPDIDLPVLMHRVDSSSGKTLGVLLLNDSDQRQNKVVRPGQRVRLRLTVADSQGRTLFVDGAPFRVVGTDGNPVEGPQEVVGRSMRIGGGGRRDVEFVMPDQPVTVRDRYHQEWGLTLSPDPKAVVREPDRTAPELDLLTYGKSAATAPSPSRYDVEQTYYLDNKIGWFEGRLQLLWLMNGQVAPHLDPIMVDEHDEVRVRWINRSRAEHPMHLHGHQVRLLSIDGSPSTGSPIWLDTVNVRPGQEIVVAFTANNPGVWMDHCHNLDHAAIGMVSHVVYRGYSTPYRAGDHTPNQPE